MELNELKALMAASLLGSTVERTRVAHVRVPDPDSIEAAVRTAQEIWEETLKQDRE